MDIIIIFIILLICCCCCCIIGCGGFYYLNYVAPKNPQGLQSSSGNTSAPSSSSNTSAPSSSGNTPVTTASTSTTPVTTASTSTTTTTPEIKIPKFIIRAGKSNWAKLIQDSDETTSSIQLSWNPDAQYKLLWYAPDNQIAVQFRYFAQYWLNKTGKNSGSTDVYVGTLSNNLGKYKFSKSGTTYTGEFYNDTWTWVYDGDYCFTKANAQRANTCMNGWEFEEGKCWASGNANGSASTKCSAYDWSVMAGYSDGPNSSMSNWKRDCDVSDTPNCKN
jgi:hypothetical protein